MIASSNAKEIRIKLTKIKADGTTEPAGEVYWHRNPLMRIWNWIKGNCHGN